MTLQLILDTPDPLFTLDLDALAVAFDNAQDVAELARRAALAGLSAHATADHLVVLLASTRAAFRRLLELELEPPHHRIIIALRSRAADVIESLALALSLTLSSMPTAPC